ncbi:MAG TPA: hypothetical protein VII69_00650 [Candidatus Eremiobacteraceae bacterium]
MSRLREQLFLGGLLLATVAVQSALLLPLSLGHSLRTRAAANGRRFMANTRRRIARARMFIASW